MDYKEYIEKGTDRDLLRSDFIETKDYEIIQKNAVIFCHDVFIRCHLNGETGLLLIKRKNSPAKNVYWPIGGRVLRGVPILESLNKKAGDECCLTLSNISYLGVARTLFKDSAFNNGKGTDTINIFYIADGEGLIKLNKDHENPFLVTKENYKDLRDSLEEYVIDILDYINNNNLW